MNKESETKPNFDTAFSPMNRFQGGWSTVKRAPLPLLFCALILSFLGWGSSCGSGLEPPPNVFDILNSDRSGEGIGETQSLDDGMLVPTLALDLLEGVEEFSVVGWWLLGFLICIFFEIGFIRLHRHIFTTHTPNFSPVFSGLDVFLNMVFLKIFRWIVLVLVASVSFFLFLGSFLLLSHTLQLPLWVYQVTILVFTIMISFCYLYFWLGFSLSEHFVALDNLKCIEAIKSSWRTVRGNRVTLFRFYCSIVLVNIISVIGALLTCGVGAIVTFPAALIVTEVAFTEAFLLCVHGGPASYAWQAPVSVENNDQGNQPQQVCTVAPLSTDGSKAQN